MTFRETMDDGTVRVSGGKSAWPVGALYFSMDSTNPGPLLGGTWARFSQGRMIIGVDEGDPSWDSPGDVGGAKTHLLDWSEMPAHAHPMNHDHPSTATDSAGIHNHPFNRRSAVGTGGGAAYGGSTVQPDGLTENAGSHAHNLDIPPYVGTTGYAGAGEPHNNMPPYLAVYIWRRTA